jgi:uncharacterized membrane protein YfcA
MTPFEAGIVVLGGLASGFINTLAGGGSAITLPILTELIGPNAANGTNRIAIQLANLAALGKFAKGKAVPWSTVLPLLPAAVLGAGLGAWIATLLSPGATRRVFAFVLIFVAASVLLKPSRWVEDREAVLPMPWRHVIFFAIGFYGGFVQAGVGFLLLAGLVLGSGLDLVKASGAKVLIIASYTPIALLFFASASQVDLSVGIVLSVGQVTGAWIAAHLALKKGAGWVRWVLVIAAVVAAGRMLLAA